MSRTPRVVFLLVALVLAACSHELQIKNLEMYRASFQIGGDSPSPRIGVMPFDGSPDDLFFFNSIVERLSRDPAVRELRTDYLPGIARARKSRFTPDFVLSIRPKTTYRSSGWNWIPINWPGFLIWTPAWHGYVYHADVLTTFVVYDRDGGVADQFEVPMSLSLRHADGDRTTWAELGWLEVSALPFFSGIYMWQNFDRDVIPPFQMQVKDTYVNFVMSQAQRRIRSISEMLVPQEATEPTEPPESNSPPPR